MAAEGAPSAPVSLSFPPERRQPKGCPCDTAGGTKFSSPETSHRGAPPAPAAATPPAPCGGSPASSARGGGSQKEGAVGRRMASALFARSLGGCLAAAGPAAARPLARSHGGAVSSALAVPLRPLAVPAPRPARAAAGRRVPRPFPRSPPPLPPRTRPGPGGTRERPQPEQGHGAAGGWAGHNPLLIKRWAPLPAPYKYAPCATRGLWPARLCRRRGAAARSPAEPPLPPGEPRPPRPSEMPRVDADLKLDFKDVLLRPKRSSLKSRSEVGAFKPGVSSLRPQRLLPAPSLPPRAVFIPQSNAAVPSPIETPFTGRWGPGCCCSREDGAAVRDPAARPRPGAGGAAGAALSSPAPRQK